MYTSYDNSSLVKIVTLLKSHKLEYLSGEDISESLMLSRAAVWKHIKKLQSLGYTIESRPKLGYRLTKTTDLLLPWEVSDGLETNLFGKKIYYFDTINSTQNFASELASKTPENGTIVIAGKQTQGKGRLDRKWTSPSGGVWFSLILRPEFEISAATLFPMVSSLALAIAIEKILKIKPQLKWPNDVTLDGKKVAGILVDASVESGKIDYLILGVGINFKIDVKKIEKEIKNTGNYYGVATLVTKSNKTNPAKLVQVFLVELERLYNLLSEGHSEYITKEWTKRSSTIGKIVNVTSPVGPIHGKASKIDKDGALVILDKGKSHRILVGDIS
ncbi:MAG TPA: biotin--[acetyl-CoA-carboxylase] ligase [Nitrosopumilaceae archaeon]|nr:biotin--[acetyl-CoA-carboxylase] ligase [Nitrosopumilaceae archaeon]